MWHGGFEPTCLFLFKEMLLISEKNPNKTTTAKKNKNKKKPVCGTRARKSSTLSNTPRRQLELVNVRVVFTSMYTLMLGYAQTAQYVASGYIRVGHFTIQSAIYCSEILCPHSIIACVRLFPYRVVTFCVYKGVCSVLLHLSGLWHLWFREVYNFDTCEFASFVDVVTFVVKVFTFKLLHCAVVTYVDVFATFVNWTPYNLNTYMYMYVVLFSRV